MVIRKFDSHAIILSVMRKKGFSNLSFKEIKNTTTSLSNKSKKKFSIIQLLSFRQAGIILVA
jgi:hypothetical protein